jgi:hypothetical protein
MCIIVHCGQQIDHQFSPVLSHAVDMQSSRLEPAECRVQFRFPFDDRTRPEQTLAGADIPHASAAAVSAAAAAAATAAGTENDVPLQRP